MKNQSGGYSALRTVRACIVRPVYFLPSPPVANRGGFARYYYLVQNYVRPQALQSGVWLVTRFSGQALLAEISNGRGLGHSTYVTLLSPSSIVRAFIFWGI